MPVKSPLQLPGLRPRESPGGGRCVRVGACSNGKTLAELGGPGCITVTIRAAQNGNLRAGGKPARRRECPTRSVPSVALGAARYPAKRKKGDRVGALQKCGSLRRKLCSVCSGISL